MNRRTGIGFAGTVLLAVGVATAISAPASAGPAYDAGMLDAMQRDLGLTEGQAMRRLSDERRAAATEKSLRGQLGAAYGGAWFDADDGSLVVGITDASKAATVSSAGASARMVDDSLAALDAAKSRLDATKAPSSVNGYFVNMPGNALVIEVERGATADKLVAKAKATGVDVRTVETDAATLFENVRGGDAWYTSQHRCSVGFSARGSGGSKHFVTAGHCTKGHGTAYGYNRQALGRLGGSTFNTKGDYGKVDVTSSNWLLTATVNRYGGGDLVVRGSNEAPSGASACRSGSTTGWRCGTVQAKNQTVFYQGGGRVSGLTRTSACAESGDSGGSFVSGDQAQGMTSGGSGNCTVGGTTYFSPVRPALSAYKLTLVTG